MLKLKRLNMQRVIFGMAMIAAIALLFISAFSLNNSFQMKNSTTQKYLGNDFSSWSVTASGTPLPAGFSWLGKGGTKLSIEIIKELGYSV